MKKIVFLILTGLILAGCNDPKAVNAKNFRQAINQNLANQDMACIPIEKFPLDLMANPFDADKSNELAALESVGLVSSVEQEKPIIAIGNVSMQMKVRHYELTEQGKTFYREPTPDKGNFCFANPQVDKIIEWTEPAASSGEIVTTVTYTYKMTKVADWAANPEIQNLFPTIKEIILAASTRQLTQMLYLTNNGWKVN